MYIHIGGSYAVSDKYILGVFDFDGTTGPGSDTIQFLRKAEKEDRVEAISFDLPRSFIVTLDRIYISPIAAATIRLRMERAGQAIRSGKWLHETDDRILGSPLQNEKTMDALVQERKPPANQSAAVKQYKLGRMTSEE